MYNKCLKSVLAGIAIALSGWMYLSAPNPTVGAFLFACGLLSVRIYGLNLFTGKIQYMITKEYKWYDYPIFLIGNFVGVMIIAAFSMGLVSETAIPIATVKATQLGWIALVKGIGCGALMSLATYKNSPLWMCIPCVMGFILAGFNHCIADFYYACVSGIISWRLIATIIGNIIGGIMFSKFLAGEQ